MRVRVLLAVIAVSAWPALAGPGWADDARSDRARAWDALRAKLPEARYLRHSVAVEAIMREMAVARIDDADQWGLAGLLHDIDIGETASDLSRHGVVGAQILRDLGFNAAVVHAVNAHDARAGVARTSRLDHAVYCADQVYWLVAATGLSFPSDKLNTALPATVWEQVQAVHSKRPVLGQVSHECAEIGLSMPRAIAAVKSASRKLSQTAAGK
ncbi:MAG: HDIG domain-containing protein [Candidatus Solibacter sp.]|nr:HDIG domain-containing protein [Candidatus Solibacter sp.]